MNFNGLDQIAAELAGWDFWSIVALLMIVLGISTKIPWGSVGFSIFIFKFLGIDWGIGFVVADALLLSLGWFQWNQIEKAVSSLDDGFTGMKKEIQGMREECEKIRKTINPHDQYIDDISEYDDRSHY